MSKHATGPRTEFLRSMWADIFPRIPAPPREQVLQWLREYPDQSVVEAVRIAGIRFDAVSQKQLTNYITHRLRQEAKKA